MTHLQIFPIDPELEALQQELSDTPEYLLYDMLDQLRYQFRRRMAEMPGGAWTQTRLAREMNVSVPVVNRMLRADQNVSLLTVARAARALRLSLCAFKLIPDEQKDSQLDELGAFVRRDSPAEPWWPRTRRPALPSRPTTTRSETLHLERAPVAPGPFPETHCVNDFSHALFASPLASETLDADCVAA